MDMDMDDNDEPDYAGTGAGGGGGDASPFFRSVGATASPSHGALSYSPFFRSASPASAALMGDDSATGGAFRLGAPATTVSSSSVSPFVGGGAVSNAAAKAFSASPFAAAANRSAAAAAAGGGSSSLRPNHAHAPFKSTVPVFPATRPPAPGVPCGIAASTAAGAAPVAPAAIPLTEYGCVQFPGAVGASSSAAASASSEGDAVAAAAAATRASERRALIALGGISALRNALIKRNRFLTLKWSAATAQPHLLASRPVRAKRGSDPAASDDKADSGSDESGDDSTSPAATAVLPSLHHNWYGECKDTFPTQVVSAAPGVASTPLASPSAASPSPSSSSSAAAAAATSSPTTTASTAAAAVGAGVIVHNPISSVSLLIKVVRRKRKIAVAAPPPTSSASSSSAASAAAEAAASSSASSIRYRWETLSVDTRIMGKVSSTVAFNGISDFQVPVRYQPSKIDPATASASSAGFPTELSPLVFSKFDYIRDYRFLNNPGLAEVTRQRPDSTKKTDVSKRIRKERNNFLSYDAKTPSGPDAALPAKVAAHRILPRLREVFELRSIWSLAALVQEMKRRRTATTAAASGKDPWHFTVKEIKAHVMFVAYRFTAGSWRNLWIRFAVDPRTDSTCARFQMIDFRLPSNIMGDKLQGSKWQTLSAEPARHGSTSTASGAAEPGGGSDDESGAAGGGSGSAGAAEEEMDIAFSRPPKSKLSLWYQLADLAGDEIQNKLASFELTAACSKETGWYTARDLDEIRTLMRRRAEGWFGVSLDTPKIVSNSVKSKKAAARDAGANANGDGSGADASAGDAEPAEKKQKKSASAAPKERKKPGPKPKDPNAPKPSKPPKAPKAPKEKKEKTPKKGKKAAAADAAAAAASPSSSAAASSAAGAAAARPVAVATASDTRSAAAVAAAAAAALSTPGTGAATPILSGLSMPSPVVLPLMAQNAQNLTDLATDLLGGGAATPGLPPAAAAAGAGGGRGVSLYGDGDDDDDLAGMFQEFSQPLQPATGLSILSSLHRPAAATHAQPSPDAMGGSS